MQITKLTFAGTVEEFATVAHLFEDAPRGEAHVARLRGRARQAERTAPEVIRAVLGRMPVPPAQRALYRALFQAGETGLNASDLAVAIKRTEQELAGVLGALGRRINRTPGVNPENPPGVDLMFEMKQQDGQWHYRMRDVLREVLEAEQPAWL